MMRIMFRQQAAAAATLVLVAFVNAEDLLAWGVGTHRLLSERAAELSVLNSGVLPALGMKNFAPTEPDTKGLH